MMLLFALEAWWVLSGAAKGFDLAVREAVQRWASVPVTQVMLGITRLGSYQVLLPLGAIVIWRLAAKGRPRQAIAFAIGGLSAEFATQVLKLAFHRTRPEVLAGLFPAETYSFPSGHSFLSAAFYGLLASVLAGSGRNPMAAAVVTSGLIGLSRVYLGYHYPSDVIAGWTCGVAWVSVFGDAVARENPPRH